MPKIPPVDAKKLIKIFGETRFQGCSAKGSHVILINDEKTRIVIPLHSGRDLKPGLTRAILREAGINREKFFKLLREE